MLAAYADGELEPCERFAVEQWLAAHTHARADVEAYFRLTQLWQVSQPREPEEGAWIAALASIRARVPVGSPSAPRRRVSIVWLAGLAAAAAAAVIVFVATRAHSPDPTP